jgi:hypothetical protein
MIRGLSTSTGSCPRRHAVLRPPPESQFFSEPEPPEISRFPAVRRSPAESHGLVTKPVPCSLHASLMEERLRARSPASDGDDHDPRRGDGQGDARPPHDADDAREATAGRTRVDQPTDPTRVRPAEPAPPSRRDGPPAAPPSGSPAPSATGFGPTRPSAGSSMDSLAQSAPWAIRPGPRPSDPDHHDPDRTAEDRIGSTASPPGVAATPPESRRRCLVLKPNRPPAGSRSGHAMPRSSPSAR